jgi:hypothetical protein
MLPASLTPTSLPKSQFSPEIEFLLCCIRARILPEYNEKVRALAQQELNWAQLVETARDHALLPLLYWQLKNICPQLVPVDIFRELQAEFNTNATRNLALTAELLKIVTLLRASKIGVLAFKGPVLAEQVYGNLALRRFADLDVLISEADVPRASFLLVSNGYQPMFNLTLKQEVKYAKLRNEHAFTHPGKQITIDLHWEVLPKGFSFSPSPELLWEKPQAVKLGGSLVETLSVENLLLFLCAHAAKHSWFNSLSMLSDIGLLISTRPDINWELVLSRAGQLGTKSMLFLALGLVSDLLYIPLPNNVTTRLKADRTLPALLALAKQLMFSHPEHIISTWNKDPLYLKTIERDRDKIWYWFDVLLTPTPLEWLAFPLPPPLSLLYYPIRLIRLTKKHLLRKFFPKN